MIQTETESHFALCVRNEECEDIDLRKIYQVIPDKKAERNGYIRVVDESGEDYLYPEVYLSFLAKHNKRWQSRPDPTTAQPLFPVILRASLSAAAGGVCAKNIPG